MPLPFKINKILQQICVIGKLHSCMSQVNKIPEFKNE